MRLFGVLPSVQELPCLDPAMPEPVDSLDILDQLKAVPQDTHCRVLRTLRDGERPRCLSEGEVKPIWSIQTTDPEPDLREPGSG